jgi:hypothetical protein
VLLSPGGMPHVTYRMAKEDKRDYIKVIDGILTKIIAFIKDDVPRETSSKEQNKGC